MSEQVTLFSLATVVDTTKFGDGGTFWAKVDALNDGAFPIHYTSPYSTNTEGGFISIPSYDARILVCRPAGETRLFYIGSTFLSPSDEGVEGGEKIDTGPEVGIEKADPKLYSMRNEPMKMSFKGQRGNGLVISQQYEGPTGKANIKTELVGQSGKKVTINDSPGVDSIILKNEHNDFIRLSTAPKGLGTQSRCATIETRGSQNYICKEGQTDVMVRNGTELNLTNYSTGNNRSNDEPLKYGNINLESKNHDINIMSRRDSGRIFIETIDINGDNQVIDIETKGGANSTIRIKSTGKAEVIAEGQIDVVAGGDINLKSDADINLEAAGKINLKSGGTIAADGSKTYLQSGMAQPSTADVTATHTGIYEVEGVYP